MDEKMKELLRRVSPASIAEELLSVQPMNVDLSKLYEAGASREELEARGYKPVSQLGLLWIKE